MAETVVREWSTIWQCKCGASGSVRHGETAGVYEVVERIRAGHDEFAKVSRCDTGLAQVRIAWTGPSRPPSTGDTTR